MSSLRRLLGTFHKARDLVRQRLPGLAMPAPRDFELVQLRNGSWSMRACKERETFHPVIGPAAEADALYVRQLRLRERLAHRSEEFVVWDVGLGGAANVIRLLQATRGLECP